MTGQVSAADRRRGRTGRRLRDVLLRRRLTGEKRGSFPLKGGHWFLRPASASSMSEREWKSNVALLMETQRSLRQPLASLPAASRHKPLIAIDKGVTRARLITGIAMHDVCQPAQISLLKRMRPHQAANTRPAISKSGRQR